MHNVSCASRKVRVLRPLVALGLMMMSLLCCLARYGLRYNYWTDVLVGFLTGLVLSIYIVSSRSITPRPSQLPLQHQPLAYLSNHTAELYQLLCIPSRTDSSIHFTQIDPNRYVF